MILEKNNIKCDLIRYSPTEINTINTISTANSRIDISIPRRDSVISVLNSYLDLIFDVLYNATKNR